MLCHVFWSQVEYKIICFIINVGSNMFSGSLYVIVCACFVPLNTNSLKLSTINLGIQCANTF